ncbi:MAG: hydroxyacylglutathione hydrolase [Nitriliruptoraceae bacterium]
MTAGARDLVVLGVPMGRFQTNCYVIGDRSTGSCVVVDPGETADQRLPAIIEQLGCTVDAILLTHAHVDHVWSVPQLAAQWDVGVHLHPEDRWLFAGPQLSYGQHGTDELVRRYDLDWQPDMDRLVDVHEGQTLTAGGVAFHVAHTPGHTPGHVTYLGQGLADAHVELVAGGPSAHEQMLLSGDLLFAGSVGRSDLVGGDGVRLIAEIHRTAMTLDDAVPVLSGHGPGTTIGHERRTNPFLR